MEKIKATHVGMSLDHKVLKAVGMVMGGNVLGQINAETDVIGLEVRLPPGATESMAFEIANNQLAQELGRLLCQSMGNPEGCTHLRVTVGLE